MYFSNLWNCKYKQIIPFYNNNLNFQGKEWILLICKHIKSSAKDQSINATVLSQLPDGPDDDEGCQRAEPGDEGHLLQLLLHHEWHRHSP